MSWKPNFCPLVLAFVFKLMLCFTQMLSCGVCLLIIHHFQFQLKKSDIHFLSWHDFLSALLQPATYVPYVSHCHSLFPGTFFNILSFHLDFDLTFETT